MSFSTWYNNYKKSSYTWRAKYFQPLLKFLAQNNITPNQITAWRLFFAWPLIYCFYRHNLNAVLFFYLLFWLTDLIDGALARYTNTANDRGRFFDSVVDNFMYGLAICGFIYLQSAWAWLFAANLVLEYFTQVLATIKKQEKQPSSWLINVSPDAPYFKSLAHIALLLYVFGVDWLNPFFVILNIWLALTCLYYFLIILKRK